MNPNPATTEISSSNAKLIPIRRRVANAVPVAQALEKARAENSAFRAKMKELEDMLNPEAKIKALETIISRETDPAIIKEAQSMIAEISSGKEQARDRARVLAYKAYQTVLASCKELILAALEELKNLEIEAEVAETALFDGFGMSREVTAVSRRVHAETTILRQMLEGLSSNNPSSRRSAPPASGGEFILKWFKT